MGDQATLEQISQLLDQSAQTRAVVGPTVIALLACTTSPDTGAQQLAQAADTRGAQAAQLAALDLASSPEAAAAARTLRAAWTASQNADLAFSRWAAAMSGGCLPNNTASRDYQQGANFSHQADAAKKAFARAWSPIAAQHSLPNPDPGSL